MTDKIRQYWDDRADQERLNQAATTNDVHLRELEIRTLERTLQRLFGNAPVRVLDVGCGDGYSTIRLAAALPNLTVHGVDFSDRMIDLARIRRAEDHSLAPRVDFSVGDVRELAADRFERPFDVAMTDRCLINLDTQERQFEAISRIAHCVRPGGYYIAIENFHDGQDAMNECRRTMGLAEIPIRWHNRFFEAGSFRAHAQTLFDEVQFENFASAYYYATRVIYSALCQRRGEEPDYEHDIHKLAVDLPPFGNFSPIRLVVMHRPAG